MRIVYDDTQQQDFVEEIDTIMSYISTDIIYLTKKEYGTDRIKCSLIKNYINHELRFNTYNAYEIADKNCDTSGIGNNHLFAVFYKGLPEETQICAYISITEGMYGEAYIKVVDFNDKNISGVYHLNGSRIRKI
jgi:hypothetical protein